MSEPVEKSVPVVEEALAANGENDIVEEVSGPVDEHGEESDEYEDVDEEEKQIVGDEDDEDEEDNEDGNDGEQRSAGLTALLLGDPNVAEEEEEEEEEGEDDEYVEEAPVPATPSGKKRTIDELVEDVGDEASEESEAKKVKA